MSTPRSRRVLAATAAALTAAALGAPPALGAGPTTQIVLGGSAADSLRAQDVRLRATKPASLHGRRLVLPVAATAANAGAGAPIPHAGGLRLTRAKRTATLSALRVTPGPPATVTARVGGRTVRVFTIRAGKVALTNAGASALRRALGLRRLKAGSFGATATTFAAPSTSPAEPAAPPAPSEPPAPPAVEAPAPAPPAPSSPTPGGGGVTQPVDPPADPDPILLPTDWTASGLEGSLDMKSWINYVLRGGGTVTASDGATRIAADNPHDFRFETTAVAVDAATGVTTIDLRGTIAYAYPAHNIDQRMSNPTIEIAADGQSARVIADGQYSVWANPDAPPIPFTRVHVVDLDLSAVTPTLSADGRTRTWTDVPATIAEGAGEEMVYGPGSNWGHLTFSVPVPA